MESRNRVLTKLSARQECRPSHREQWRETNWEPSVEIRTLPRVWTDSPGEFAVRHRAPLCSVTTQRGRVGWELVGGLRGRDTCVPVADSWWCVAEANTTLQSNCSSIIVFFCIFFKTVQWWSLVIVSYSSTVMFYEYCSTVITKRKILRHVLSMKHYMYKQ